MTENLKTRTTPAGDDSVWFAIVVGGLIGGAFDLTYALVYYGFSGVHPIRIPQSIASGLLGPGAFQGGAKTAVLGVLLHFVIALGAAAVFNVASRSISFLLRQPIVSGVLFGAAVYAFMHGVVLPLSAAPKFKSAPATMLPDLAVHMLLIGPSIALAARKYAKT